MSDVTIGEPVPRPPKPKGNTTAIYCTVYKCTIEYEKLFQMNIII